VRTIHRWAPSTRLHLSRRCLTSMWDLTQSALRPRGPSARDSQRC
jgi:hypothetical protein